MFARLAQLKVQVRLPLEVRPRNEVKPFAVPRSRQVLEEAQLGQNGRIVGRDADRRDSLSALFHLLFLLFLCRLLALSFSHLALTIRKTLSISVRAENEQAAREEAAFPKEVAPR